MKKEKDKKQNDEVESLNKKITELDTLLEQEKASKLMVLADFMNFKKRLENEKNDYRIFATKMIMTQLMQITDDYQRVKNDIAKKLDGNKVSEDVFKGLQMLNDKIEFIITQYGFEPISIKEGDKFNSSTMEALTTAPVKEKDKDGTVLMIDQKGYKHIESGIIFKTAKVIIGKYMKQ